jgi:hypothetical protein
MGMIINYQGQLDTVVDLPKLIEELTDIANSMKWTFTPIERDADNREFTGLILNPPGQCLSLCFIFDQQGRIRNLVDLIIHQDHPDPHTSYHVFVKTQFPEIAIHNWIVSLLRYLKKKYLSNLKIHDYGESSGSGNTPNLQESHTYRQSKINPLAAYPWNSRTSNFQGRITDPM